MTINLRPSWPAIAAFLGSLILALLKDAIQGILKTIVGSALSAWIVLLAIVIVAGVGVLLLNRAMQPKPRTIVPTGSKPPRMKGLIVLVGPGAQGRPAEEQAAAKAIEYHQHDAEGTPVLRVCWLIPSTAQEAQLYASQLKEELQKHGVIAITSTPVDAFNLYDTFGVVTQIYEQDLKPNRLEESEVIADFTGGTKLMSTGMAMACLAHDRPMQYMTGRQPGVASAPMLVKFEPRS